MREERSTEANGKPAAGGGYVLYWMQAACRAEANHALDRAAAIADERGLPLAAAFCLSPGYPGASPAHYRFLLEGLKEARAVLADKGVRLVVVRGDPRTAVPILASRAAVLVMDAGYTRMQRAWRSAVAAAVPCRAVLVEGETVVPPALASAKEEWSAFTLRRKISPLVPYFLEDFEERAPRAASVGLDLGSGLEEVDLDGPLPAFGTAPARAAEFRPGGTWGYPAPGRKAALARFGDFLRNRLETYATARNDPNLDGSSGMGAALHFGQAGAIELARAAKAAAGRPAAGGRAAGSLGEGADAFLEELVVRRELAVNMAARRDDYDSPSCLPDWARRTLAEGALHPRERIYAERDLEFARTDDPYWNAAQDQMVLTGRMHGYLRMYWGKRLLAWTRTPEEAWALAVRLNDAYSLDGRDPNGYAGIAWCFGKHDRPWTGRPVYGTVRYMNAAGLRRKFDADRWAASVAALKEEACSTTWTT